MRVDFVAFWLPKDGIEPRQYEDAFAPASVDGGPRLSLRCAVADGATESAFSRAWARQLARGFAGGRLSGPDLAELPTLARRWSDTVAQALGANEPAPWYLERKIEDGAFAALIGMEFADLAGSDDTGTYAAIALGDSCFVHVRDDALQYAFPLDNSASFTARPMLVPSRPTATDSFAGAIARKTGRWKSGDAFYLMSDAFACWFLASVEQGAWPWRDLDRFTRVNRAAFRDWVHALRALTLKNDDVTVVRIRVFR